MKKGAYDLGRKAIYYIVVIIIIAVLFVIISGSFRKFQIVRLSTLNDATDFVIMNNVVRCVSQQDVETGRVYLYKIDDSKLNADSLINCLGKDEPYKSKSVMIQLSEIEIKTQEPQRDYSKYEKTVVYNGEEKTLKIYIEKYGQIS